MTRFARKR
uniref:Uncharacterized protein n=1 Tax=Anguilla anguilla TaxID=7936 RepID=A0A0E9VL40_ANGAN